VGAGTPERGEREGRGGGLIQGHSDPTEISECFGFVAIPGHLTPSPNGPKCAWNVPPG